MIDMKQNTEYNMELHANGKQYGIAFECNDKIGYEPNTASNEILYQVYRKGGKRCGYILYQAS